MYIFKDNIPNEEQKHVNTQDKRNSILHSIFGISLSLQIYRECRAYPCRMHKMCSAEQSTCIIASNLHL